jgi:hypothetical protein
MPFTLTVHEPHLVNLLGHTIGALLFGAFLALLLGQPTSSRRSALAAGLALLWNCLSIAALAAQERGWDYAGLLAGAGVSALLLLPAVLLHIALAGRARRIVQAGYFLSGVSTVVHAIEGRVSILNLGNLGLAIGTAGFGALTLLSAVLLWRRRQQGDRRLTPRIVASMSLFLLAVSFSHLGHREIHTPWALELLIHHAGVPLALLVLMQDYRFILVDVFLRLAAGLTLSAAFFTVAISVVIKWNLLAGVADSPVRQAVLFVAGILLLLLYGSLLPRVQTLLTRLVFGRQDFRALQDRLQALCSTKEDETTFYLHAIQLLRDFFRAAPCPAELEEEVRRACPDLTLPVPVSALPGLRGRLERAGAEVVIPFRLGEGDLRVALMGRRSGGRRYLSEDLHLLAHLARQITEHIEHYRAAEMRRLVAQAELRALESQIHPHFLFNALNTLYGSIPREAKTARRIVLNLADILRYCLQPDRTLIPLEKELEIVRSYLEIEKLRLGERLDWKIEVEPSALAVSIPVLSVQPLVENAVKHGISRQEHGGAVRVEAQRLDSSVLIRISDTGGGLRAHRPSPSVGHGLGLANVMRRLKLCYGEDSDLLLETDSQGTRVEFRVPAGSPQEVKT